jgi:hypothetical protein
MAVRPEPLIAVPSLHEPFSNENWPNKAKRLGIAARPRLHGFSSDVEHGLLNELGSLYMFSQIFTANAIFGCFVSVVCTSAYWYYGAHTQVNMSWNIASMGLFFPITQAIGMAFKRREQALNDMGRLLGNLRSLWGAIHAWKFKNEEKQWVILVDSLDDCGGPEEARRLFDRILTSIVVYFDHTRWRRARHAMLLNSKEETELKAIAKEQRLCVDAALGQLQRLVQHFKTKGLPGGEAHRLDQYCYFNYVAMERLSALKEYRTPQIFRAFARIYIQFLAVLYGPYYCYLGGARSDGGGNFGLAIAFGLGTQIALSGLYNVMLALEDPFCRRGGRGQQDSVRVFDLVEVTRRMLLAAERQSKQNWNAPAQKEHWFAPDDPVYSPPLVV